MKLLNYIFYLFLLASVALYSCEKEAPDTTDPSLAEADEILTDYIALQSHAYEVLNMVGNVLLKMQDQIESATDTPELVDFDDCNAQVSIVKTTDGVQITIDYKQNNCPDAITQRTRNGKIIVNQVGVATYYSSGHQMTVSFDNFQLNSQTLAGTLSVKNTSKTSAFTIEDTVKQALTFTDFLFKEGISGSGYQERGLIRGLQSRSIGDDLYWSDTTNISVTNSTSSNSNYVVIDTARTADPVMFDMYCWNTQVFFPTQGRLDIEFKSASVDRIAHIDFGTGACERFKEITLTNK